MSLDPEREPREDELAEKPPPEPLPDDVDEDADDEDVPEEEYLDPAVAAEDPTIDDAERDEPGEGAT